MKFFGMGGLEFVIILVVILLIFGPKNLPKLGKAFGKTVSNLRAGMNEGKKEEIEEEAEVEDESQVADEVEFAALPDEVEGAVDEIADEAAKAVDAAADAVDDVVNAVDDAATAAVDAVEDAAADVADAAETAAGETKKVVKRVVRKKVSSE